MHEIHRILRAAAWRLGIVAFARNVVYTVAAALIGFILLRLVQQLWPLEREIPWLTIAYYSAGASVLVALVWTIVARDSEKAVARRVDEGADLRESLSTALCVQGTDDPWAKMTVESASHKAKGVNLKQAVPLQPPKFWPVPLALGLSLLVVWLAISPRETAEGIAKAEDKAKVIEVSSHADEVKKIEALVAELDPASKGEAGKDDADAGKTPEAVTPQEISLQAIKKLTTALDRLEQLKQGEQGLTKQTVEEMLKELKTPGPGPLAEMSKELAKGNFSKAAKELAEQMKKAQSGEMSDKDKKALADQLKKVSEQLAKLAEDRKQAEKELEKAGLNKELAKDPKKLAEALKNAKNLTEEQKKQLENMVKAQNEACKACNKMGDKMSEMAQSMSQNGKMDPSALNAMQDLAEQMGQLEQLSKMMNSADSAMNEAKEQMAALAKFCEGGECKGMGECDKPGNCDKMGAFKSGDYANKPGGGSGGPGQGRGTQRGEEKAAYTMKIEKNKTKTQAGPTIASEIIAAGEQERGESVAGVSDAVAAADQNASEALDGNQIPREFHDAVKHYFGRLKAKTQAGGDAGKDGAKSEGEKKDDAKTTDTK
jgi:hypothetical protein